MVATTAEWLIAYALHSTVLLAAVYVLERARLLVELDVRETAWRTATFGALLTATLQMAMAPSNESPATEQPVAVAPRVAITETPITNVAADSSAIQEPPRVSPSNGSREVPFGASWLPALTSTSSLTVPIDVRKDAIAFVWFLIAFAGVALLGWQFREVRRRCANGEPCVERGVHRDVATLAERARVRVGAIRQIEGATSPMVIPPSLLCIPSWALTELDELRRRAMLAHEIAHFMRRDQWWRLIYQAFVRVMFFQPLNRLAVRRLEVIAELACDEWAAGATTRRAAAECLAACGEHIAARSPRFASAIIESDSTLVERVRTVLQERRRVAGRVIAARGVLALAIVGVMLLPVVVFEAPAVAEVKWSADDMSGSGIRKTLEFDFGRLRFEDVTTMKVRKQGSSLGARLEGHVRFAATEDSIAELEGRAVIEEVVVASARDGGERRVEVENTDEGIAHRYTVDGLDQPFEPDGRRFLGDAVPMLLRETAYDAENRIARIIDAGGQDALLDEAARIESEWSRGKYLAELVTREQLDSAHQDRVLSLVAPMRSDYVLRKALVTLVERQKLASEQQAKILELVAQMNSDFEQRKVLVQLAPTLNVDDASVVAAWSAALATVDADYEARVAVVSLAERSDLSAALVAAELTATKDMGADYEARMALTALAPHIARMPALASAYAESARRIDSDFELRKALTLLVDTAALDAAGFKAVIAAAESIGSPYECSRVVKALPLISRRMSMRSKTIVECTTAAAARGSSHVSSKESLAGLAAGDHGAARLVRLRHRARPIAEHVDAASVVGARG